MTSFPLVQAAVLDKWSFPQTRPPTYWSHWLVCPTELRTVRPLDPGPAMVAAYLGQCVESVARLSGVWVIGA
jgi:hypothetical protein